MGADGLVPTIVRLASDRRALSDELHFAATNPDERYHLDHGRANALRALDIPAGAEVLEVGADYGALTRHLGERSTTVHAVEPDPERAGVAAARTADLPGVTLAGSLGELPEAAYDLAVVAGRQASPGLLRRVASRLRPPAALVVHAGDLIERREAERALRAAGLAVARVLTCRPGHPVARAVCADELAAEQPRLAAELSGPRPPGFLLLAGAAGALWPNDRLATYFNTDDRAAVWCTRADVVRTLDSPTGAEVRRAPLLDDPPPVAGIRVRRCVDAVRDAPTILAVLLEEPWRAAELLTGWRELLRERAPVVGPALWDLVPHNVLMDGSTLRPIDLEWEHAFAGVPEVTERGVLVLAHYLTEAGWSGAAPDSPMRELAGWLGVLLGLDPSFVDDAVAREVDFGTIGGCGTRRGAGELRAAIQAIWEDRLARCPGECEGEVHA
jgi:precorrin-6B methylase 2